MKIALLCSTVLMVLGAACTEAPAINQPAPIVAAQAPVSVEAAQKTSSCNDPARNYFTHDKKQCQVIRFMCPVGEVPFSDRCGCGCIDACPAGACPSPAPMSPTQLCSDGSTAGPECQMSTDGTCGWIITTCP